MSPQSRESKDYLQQILLLGSLSMDTGKGIDYDLDLEERKEPITARGRCGLGDEEDFSAFYTPPITPTTTMTSSCQQQQQDDDAVQQQEHSQHVSQIIPSDLLDDIENEEHTIEFVDSPDLYSTQQFPSPGSATLATWSDNESHYRQQYNEDDEEE